MADTTPAAQKPPAPTYTLKFEPVGEFNETELFVRNRVTGQLWISETVSVTLRSLTGREVDAIHEAIKIGVEMTAMHYQTEVTYRNLAHSIVKIGDKEFTGKLEEKLDKIKDMSGVILLRMSLAYAEFSDHVSELFAGQKAVDVAKKS